VELFFNSNFQHELKKVEILLGRNHFRQYCREFAKASRMKGITALFHGDPGCGKTEYVLQLARATKRPIMKLNVTDFMSKWIGDSELNLTRVFDRYKQFVKDNPIAPILFLNECDQIIGKRVGVNDSVDQMSNALQNILLEQLENFHGILIGTSNLVNNMDKAFERRFLLKLEFPAPEAETQIRIWQSLMPNLPLDVIERIIAMYNFSPSEINNVVKRYRIEKMIVPKTKECEAILSLCESEKFDTQKISNIGFR
jgi:SpoVK/Ycf46/Vps4 family AAA+-type ATPase